MSTAIEEYRDIMRRYHAGEFGDEQFYSHQVLILAGSPNALNVKVRGAEECEVSTCSCGARPVFVIPDVHYSDCWMMCPECGKRTVNTGGYRYAREIPLWEAKKKAIELWNCGAAYVKG